MRLVTFSLSPLYREIFALEGFLPFFKLRSYNTPAVGLSLTTFRPNQAAYSKYYSSLTRVLENSRSSGKTTKKFNNNPKIILLQENGKETSMYFNEAEKYAKSKNLKLIELPGNNKEKQKYELKKVCELFQDKSITTNSRKKKFIIKDTINEHDFKIKINSMLRILEKQQLVECIIDVTDCISKLDEKFNIIKNSKLNEYLIKNVKSSRRLTLTFEKKS